MAAGRSFFDRVMKSGFSTTQDSITTSDDRISALRRAGALPIAPPLEINSPRSKLEAPKSEIKAEIIPSSLGLSDSEAATPDDLEIISACSDRLLTKNPSSPFYLDEANRRSAAVLPDFTLVVVFAHRDSLIVSDIKARGRAAGTPIRAIKTVEISFLHQLYQKQEETSANDFTRNQHILYKMIGDAAAVRASDIHITMNTSTATLHHTVKGDFLYVCELPRAEAQSVVFAAFNACKTGDKQLNLLKPRSTRLDSSVDFSLPKGVQSLRCEFSPGDNSSHRTVARLLYSDADDSLSDIDSLGYRKPQIAALSIMRRQAYGVILISGPTGSGKSTTLKTALERMWAERKGRANIITIEDPPEYHIKGTFQIPIQSGASAEERQAAFRAAMSSMLRMAPHVGMVGEIRDSVAARLTFDMAKTGHLVWASVHANTALDSLIRVRDMEIKDIDLEDPNLMRGLIAQRLVKTVCPSCALRWSDRDAREAAIVNAPLISPDLAEFYDSLPPLMTGKMRLANPGGCPKCTANGAPKTGHFSRRVVAETIVPTREILRAVTAGDIEKAKDLQIAEEGAVSMLEHGLWRVIIGETDPRDLAYVGDVTSDIKKDRIESIIAALNA